MGDSQILVTWTHAERKLHIFGLEQSGKFGPPSLGYIITGHQVMVTTVSTHRAGPIPNTQGGTHSQTLLRLEVGLFLWLQTQDIAVRTRHIPGCLTVMADRLSQPNQPITTEWSLHPKIVNRIFGTWGTATVDISPKHTSSPVYISISEPRAL